MTAENDHRWYDEPDPTGQTSSAERGLRFECTSCGNCCSGPPGYVNFTDDEAKAMASAIGVSDDEFWNTYTHDTTEGRSLTEVPGPNGHDCVFLDRESQPGKALCRVYEARPEQCRTWPFWGSVVRTPRTWASAARGCPGMNQGPLHAPEHIRLTVNRVEM